MSWLSELRWSNRLEHLYAMIAGDAELDETVPSTYDRKQGFLYKIAQKIAELSEGGGSGGGVVFVDCTKSGQVITATKTAGEIFGLIMDGNSVVFRLLTGSVDTLMPCLSVMRKSIGLHKFSVHLSNDIVVLGAGTASDYPTSGDDNPGGATDPSL